MGKQLLKEKAGLTPNQQVFTAFSLFISLYRYLSSTRNMEPWYLLERVLLGVGAQAVFNLLDALDIAIVYIALSVLGEQSREGCYYEYSGSKRQVG